jgi:hypothetical protein
MTRIELAPDHLRKYFALSNESPTNLIWIVARSSKIKPGDKAGCLNGQGYYQLKLHYRSLLVHRIVWALANNQDPRDMQIDHIDMNRSNNSPGNLRLADQRLNHQRRTNTSSHGVGVKPMGDKYQARIRIDGKLLHLGTFLTRQDAIDAYQAAVASLGFSLPHYALPVPQQEVE